MGEHTTELIGNAMQKIIESKWRRPNLFGEELDVLQTELQSLIKEAWWEVETDIQNETGYHIGQKQAAQMSKIQNGKFYLQSPRVEVKQIRQGGHEHVDCTTLRVLAWSAVFMRQTGKAPPEAWPLHPTKVYLLGDEVQYKKGATDEELAGLSQWAETQLSELTNAIETSGTECADKCDPPSSSILTETTA